MIHDTIHKRLNILFTNAIVISVLTILLPLGLLAQDSKPAKMKTHRSFDIECMQCHTTSSWNDLKPNIEFEHKRTGYALVGNHASVKCESCHKGVSFDALKTTCNACHEDQHNGEFGDRCQSCHTPNGWRSPNEAVSKHQLTRFPLLGAHAQADCISCHQNQVEKEYVNTPSDCISCHREDFESTKEPDHVAGSFSPNCANCHDIASFSWEGGFAHPYHEFMQAAAHINLECEDCHSDGYAGTPQDCFGCHIQDYNAAKQPDHVAGGYDKNCLTCHSAIHWTPATFDHNQTTFALQGAHEATPCESCHTTGLSKLPTDCWSCHESDYQAAVFPDHAQGQFDHDCGQCHNVTAWQPANFNHDLTNFRLSGAHRRALCQQCHVDGQYTGLPLNCQGCHTETYQQTAQPNHQLVGFTLQCEDCHNTEAWQPVERMPLTIDHDKTNFPLLGGHRPVDCIECHAGFVFAGTSQDCFVCHRDDYDNVQAPNHVAGSFDTNCLTCHTMDAWVPATFDHNTTLFALTGAHQATPCQDCHINGDYQITYVDCYQCHEPDFTQVQNPDHVAGNFEHDCTRCHNTIAWTPAAFDHATTLFALTGAHQATPCQDCHINGDYQITYVDCYQCHEPDFTQAQNPDHVAGNFEHDCTKCHNTTAWTPADFDHATTLFALTGAHQSTPCQDCHINGDYQITYTDCFQCHEADFTQTKDPDHIAGNFEHDCTKCHNTTAWTPADFDHATTLFALTGAHQATPCQDCHINGDYQITYTDCFQCHEPDFTQTKDPDHIAGNFEHDCTKCHNTTAWTPADFDHATTLFALTGAHQSTPCQDCHINGDYQITYTDCFQCHEPDFTQTKDPDHIAGNFEHDCTKCHNTTAWTPADFDHATTLFALTGAHQATPCQDCHINGDYQITYVDCFQCHDPDFTQAKNPDHVAGNFEHDCTNCHNTTAWTPADFDHAATLFALTGAHQATPCQDCHINGDYQITYTDCFQCHDPDFTQAKNPDHVAGNFEHDCTKCHNTTAWTPADFDHAATLFALTGAHQATPCQDCHINGDYQITYVDCFQCHDPDFTQAKDPDHVAGQFSHDCTSCHTTTSWTPSTLDHGTTNFALEGAHIAEPCQSCHVNGDYQLIYTDCFQCHESDYNSVVDPNHLTGNFAHNCSVCHNSTAWLPAQLDHSSTGLPLTGKHTTLNCEDCHVGGDYTITFTDCKQCHEADFNNAKNPDHLTGQFSNDCIQCHTTDGWVPSTFNHDGTALPLLGAHIPLACAECHVGGNYNLSYTNCLQCHQSDYNAVVNPSHSAGQFSTDCLTCHTMAGWVPSTFDHALTNFPLIGGHQVAACQSCHIAGNYNLTYVDCWQCHEADFSAVQDPSHATGQFPHDCLRCHTQNAWEPSTFDHNATNFALLGAHQVEPCQSCHIAGNYNLTYIDCWQCHETDFNATTNPGHVAGQFSHDCTSCHGNDGWSPATFDHGQTNFPLQGAHTVPLCQDCHINGNYNLSYLNCYQCHQADYASALNPNHATSQFPQDCTVCHTQITWTPSTFDHSATNFPLTGAHQTRPCIDCHIGGNYNLSYVDCYQCHATDFTGVTLPNHVTNQFSHDCTSCHSTTAWIPSTFNHNNTNFPLQGAHVSRPCNDCHISGNYNITYNDCYQCHQSDYNGANSPANHQALNLDHDCSSCHTQTTWAGATLFYTSHNVNAPVGFPISGGGVKHRRPGEWSNCADCHTTNSTAAFCCTTCHEHDDPVDLAGKHSSVGGYSYNCTSCAASGCHPDGEEP